MAEEKKTVKKAPTKKAPTPVKKTTTTSKVSSEKKTKVEAKKLAKEQAQVLGKAPVKNAFAIAKNVRIAPRKVRLVIDLIRGEDIKRAKAILTFTRRNASKPILGVLNSAIANAVNNVGLREDKLYVSTCYATQGRTIKRMLPRARGSADTIQKRSSHIVVYVSERN